MAFVKPVVKRKQPSVDWMTGEKIPKSFFFSRGKLPGSLRQLQIDLRKLMLPFAALKLESRALLMQKLDRSGISPSYSKAYIPLNPTRVDWDKLEAQVKKEEKEEKLDGDAALNKFFRDIYQDADEDTRKAMRKSFKLKVEKTYPSRRKHNIADG